MLTENDKKILTQRGITENAIDEQLNRFKTGFPYLKLANSATVGNGILRLDERTETEAIRRWNQYLADGGNVLKFVPASGAASRMFKSLYAFINSADEKPAPGSDVDKILDNLDRLPFINELNEVLINKTGQDAISLKNAARFKEIISAIVNPDGMNYGNLPKGLLSFHRYPNGRVRTPLEEQMYEGVQTVAGVDKIVNLHFTVSGSHRELFNKKIAQIKPLLEKEYGVKFNISLSEQKPSTDTIAVNPDNSVFRDENGNMVFRPGGHGALIENLSDLNATVVFIKNIDNIVPDSERADTIRYKKVIGGILIETHDTITRYYELLQNGNYDRSKLMEMIDFLENRLSTYYDGLKEMSDKEIAEYLKSKFNRPLRVCGMVVNEGEPGGGPYLAYNQDGSYSPQILESTQIDMTDSAAVSLLSTATHFNPVDLVCYLKDFNGKSFNLKEFVDENTGFISEKSSNGRELKALELPGLWNGAMSDWSTVFVEVPPTTFNPVKTVNDLLRPVHQADK